MSAQPPAGRLTRVPGRRAPAGLLVLVALLLAVALERASGHAAAPPLQAVAFSDPGRGAGLFVAAGPSRCVASEGSTSDGGAHFGALVVVAGWRCAGSAPVGRIATDGRGDVFLYGPRLVASHDGGRHWARVPVSGRVLTVAAIGRSVWMALGGCTGARACPLRILRSADGGRSWAATPARPPGAAAAHLSGADGQTWLLRTGTRSAYALAGATLSQTSDGGASWARRASPCRTPAISTVLAVAPSGTLFAVCAAEPGAGSQAKWLAVSANGGRSWTARGPCRSDPAAAHCAHSPLSEGYLGEAVATSAATLYVIGDRAALTLTRDGGRTWQRAAVGDPDGEPAQVVFFGAREGLVLGRENTAKAPIAIWHTRDAGGHWTAVTPSAAS